MIEVAIIRDKTGSSRGFGFVTFKDEASMDGALRDGDEHVINGVPVEVKRSTHGESAVSSSKKVFVGGVGPRVSKETLREYFSTFGAVSDAQVMYDYVSGRSRGFGFVTFEDEAAAKACLETKVHVMAGQMVDVKAAMPRPGERQGSVRGGWRFAAGQQNYGPRGVGAGNFFQYPYMTGFTQYPLAGPYHPAMGYGAMGGPAGYGSQMAYAAYGSPQFMMAPGASMSSMEQSIDTTTTYDSSSSSRSGNLNNGLHGMRDPRAAANDLNHQS
jgi:hypothetical protein